MRSECLAVEKKQWILSNRCICKIGKYTISDYIIIIATFDQGHSQSSILSWQLFLNSIVSWMVDALLIVCQKVQCLCFILIMSSSIRSDSYFQSVRQGINSLSTLPVVQDQRRATVGHVNRTSAYYHHPTSNLSSARKSATISASTVHFPFPSCAPYSILFFFPSYQSRSYSWS